MALDEGVKQAEPEPTEAAIPDDAEVDEGGDDDEGPNGEPSSVTEAIASVAAASGGKSKKKKKGKAKAALQKLKPGGDVKLEDKMTDELQQSIVDNVRKANGDEAAGQLASLNRRDLGRLLDQLNVLDVAQGKAGIGGKNRKDMGEYKFWGTQPVRRLDDKDEDFEEGAIEPDKTDAEIRHTPIALPNGYEWVTVDLRDPVELQEVYELLTFHYVEDDDAMFRFDYSAPFINWALRPPGYVQDWHVGVRVSSGQRKLIAFIAGTPLQLRVRAAVKSAVDINFMCIHKKMRSKRLAPVLIKEVTRRCHEKGIFQALYTGGVFLPTPVSRCQYFHRNLNPPKLIATGFSAQPRGVSMARLNRMYSRPPTTELAGWREMVPDDLPAVARLTRRYLARFELAQVMDDDEIEHAYLNGRGTGEVREGRREGQVVWTFVVENPATRLITDVVSFSFLPSTAMRSTPHQTLEAAYLFLYATTVAPACADLGTSEGAPAAETNGELKIKTWLEESLEERRALKKRLMALIGDALTVAQKAKFDVFNALTILDNTLFLSDLQFGPGDGYLHYYLYNWKVHGIRGGVAGERGGPQGVGLGASTEGAGSGVGVVML